MRSLMFLDLSNNQIKNVNSKDLPESLAIVKFIGNPCTEKDGYRSLLVAGLELLDELDGISVSVAERLHY